MTYALISASQGSKEVTANNRFTQLAPVALFGYCPETSSGLTWGYTGGKLLVAGVPTAIADSTIALTDNATNYLYSTSAGVVTKATVAPGGWPGPLASGAFALYQILTVSGAISGTPTDYRTSTVGGGSASASGTATGTGFPHITGGVQDPAAKTVDQTLTILTVAATVAFSATPNFDCSLGSVFDITLTGNVTGATFTNGVDGRSYLIRARQDGTGSRTWAFGAGVRFGTDITTFTATTTASKLDYITVRYNGTDSKYDFVSYVRGF